MKVHRVGMTEFKMELQIPNIKMKHSKLIPLVKMIHIHTEWRASGAVRIKIRQLNNQKNI